MFIAHVACWQRRLRWWAGGQLGCLSALVDTCLPTWERSSAGVLPGEARAAGKECTHPPTMHSHTHTHARAHTHMHTHTLRSLHVHKHTHAVTSPRPHELTVLPAAANSCITASPGPGIQGLRDQASADHSSHTSSRCLWAQRRGGAPSLSICLSVSVEVSANLGEPPGQTLGAPCMGTFSLSLRWGAPSPPSETELQGKSPH